MNPLTNRVVHAVRDHFPGARCFSCLATQLAVTEPEVRSAAQMLVTRAGFMPVRRVCYGCSRIRETLVPGERNRG